MKKDKFIDLTETAWDVLKHNLTKDISPKALGQTDPKRISRADQITMTCLTIFFVLLYLAILTIALISGSNFIAKIMMLPIFFVILELISRYPIIFILWLLCGFIMLMAGYSGGGLGYSGGYGPMGYIGG